MHEPVSPDMADRLELWDYRRRVADIYSDVRSGGREELTWRRWVRRRDELFGTHPQTPLEHPESFTGLPYFDHDPTWRTVARFVASAEEPWGEFLRIGTLQFELRTVASSLPLFWLNVYGGGVFVPFRDRTNGTSTYGGGRYLLDTVKGADLGQEGASVILDFNYSYHPSCVHSDRWACPLAPLASDLQYEVTAGERLAETT